MKRKIIKQGGGGYTIYLPKKWVDAKGLEAKDELNIEEKENKLILSTDSSKTKSCHIKIKAIKERFFDKLLVQSYRQGFDNITLSSENELSVSDLLKITTNLIGLELVNKTRNEVDLVVYNTDEVFDIKKIFLKAFQGMIMVFNEFINSDFSEKSLKDILILQQQYENQCNLFRRLIEKHSEKKSLRDGIIRTTNLLTNKIRYFCKKIIETQALPNENVIKYFEEITNDLRTISKSVYGNINVLVEVGEKKSSYSKLSEQLLESSKGTQIIYAAYLLETHRLLFGLYSMLVGFKTNELVR